MKLIVCLAMALAVVALVASGEQQRILRRVIKSTPTATNLARVRLVTVRAANGAESGAVTEITSKEAASFGQRSENGTTSGSASQIANAQPVASGLKSKQSSAPHFSQTSSTTTSAPSTTSTTTSTTSTTAAPKATQASSSPTAPTKLDSPKPKASDRQQASSGVAEVELLAGAPSSWQTMTAVEAPAAMLIATGTRAAVASSASDLSSASSTLYASEESAAAGDFLRAGAAGTKGGAYSQQQQSVGETFSRLRQQSASKQQQQQQSFFYPQPAPVRASASKTSNQQASKTHWYQQPITTSTPRPAPIVQEQYEQQNEQYTQQQVEYGSAPLGQAEPFAFDFKTEDNSGNGQYRKEESDKNGVVHGSYGYTDANGIYRHVEYVADKDGFRANIKSNEPGLIGETQPASIQLSGSGPAPNQRLATRPQSNSDNGEWTGNNNEGNNENSASSADLALAPPDFESAHRSDRLRLPRHYRN